MRESAILFLFILEEAIACKDNVIAAYKVKFTAFWHPNMYSPLYPKTAHWSEMFIQSHAEDYHLFQIDEVVSDAFTQFASEYEPGKLFNEGMGEPMVYDQLVQPGVWTEVGSSQHVVFADGQHSYLSLASVAIPTTDWFVGVDSFNLYSGSEWIDAGAVNLKLLDAGVINGPLFSMNKTTTDPPEPVVVLDLEGETNGYTHFEEGDLARVEISKLQEYLIKTNGTVERLNVKREVRVHSGLEDDVMKVEYVDDVINTLVSEKLRPKKLREMAFVSGAKENDCVVSNWSEWSPCSVSERRMRFRYVLRRNKGDGTICPNLVEIAPNKSCHD